MSANLGANEYGRQSSMFQFTESIQIRASLDRAWNYLVDVEKWWPPSNPEHESLEIIDRNRPLSKGTKIRFRERVAGIPGEMEGEVTEYAERDHITWESSMARYALCGLTFDVREGVRWNVRDEGPFVILSATVWAIFPNGLKGSALEWLFKGPLRGEAKDRLHARRELEYVKRELERS